MSELLQEAAPCQRQATDVQKYIFFIGTQQPCHADAGLFGGMEIYDSMWSIYACGLAVPCLCLVYTFFMPCLCLVCGYGVICEAAMSCR